MKSNSLLVLAGLLMAAPAFAANTLPEKANAKAAARAALGTDANEAATPTPPTLPSQASDQARNAHEKIAFGQKGDAERATHSQAGLHASEAESQARVDAAAQSAKGAAASAAKSANADSHAAAGLARATSARGGSAPATPPAPRGR